MRCLLSYLACILALAAAPSCRAQSSPGASGLLEVPSAAGSGQPYLYTDDEGTLWMSWIERVDSTSRALRYAYLADGTWSEPATIAHGTDLFANWADIPKLIARSDGRAAAHYSVQQGGGGMATDFLVAQKSDTWREPVRPHDDGTPTEHGFGSALHVADGLLTVWLDGRETNPKGEHHDEASRGEMNLYSAVIESDGDVTRMRRLDGRVCDCCPTAVTRTNGGALVAYRDRSDDERRDISLVRFEDGVWSDPYPLHEDGWIIAGCPVNGPALASGGETVVAGWFTAAREVPRVQVAFSNDGGHSFGAPVLVDDAQPRGRVDVALLDDGSALISWIGIENRMNALKVVRVTPGGVVGAPFVIAVPKSPAFTGMPQLERVGEDVYAAWVDGGRPDATEILLARYRVADFR